MRDRFPQVVLMRHGATEWARDGRHTGRSDIPLLPEGEAEALAAAPKLAYHGFALVLASPLERAWRTCELAGFGTRAEREPDDTIRKGIVDLGSLTAEADVDPMDFVYIMMSALLAAALWLLVATRKGWPVSTTHSIVGGIVGSSITPRIMASGAASAFSLVHWVNGGVAAYVQAIPGAIGFVEQSYAQLTTLQVAEVERGFASDRPAMNRLVTKLQLRYPSLGSSSFPKRGR